MHTRRLAALLLGAWLAGSVFMAVSAVGSFRAANRVLGYQDPAVRKRLESLPADSARWLLRFSAAEFNRAHFSGWELAQLGVGAGVLLCVAFKPKRVSLTLAALLLALVAAQHWFITPRIERAGRAADFSAEDAAILSRAEMGRYHNAYSAIEAVKLAIMVGLSAKLLLYGLPRRTRKQVHAVHHADHG
ncbi:MAG: hypothetical protein KIT09_35205 [Bryobacteraceae bacterium]|nr:hypothetical protein [Bryobacteraceae bacterium]